MKPQHTIMVARTRLATRGSLSKITGKVHNHNTPACTCAHAHTLTHTHTHTHTHSSFPITHWYMHNLIDKLITIQHTYTLTHSHTHTHISDMHTWHCHTHNNTCLICNVIIHAYAQQQWQTCVYIYKLHYIIHIHNTITDINNNYWQIILLY